MNVDYNSGAKLNKHRRESISITSCNFMSIIYLSDGELFVLISDYQKVIPFTFKKISDAYELLINEINEMDISLTYNYPNTISKKKKSKINHYLLETDMKYLKNWLSLLFSK